MYKPELNNSKRAVSKQKEEGEIAKYEGWNFNSGNYIFTTDTK